MTSKLQKILSLIKFEKLSDELSDQEFVQFMTKASKTIDRKIIMNLFRGKLLNASDHHTLINQCIKLTSTIIQNRDRNNNDRSVHKIDQLTPELLGEIASYLQQKDYVILSRCNKNIFAATNSPNTLLDINLGDGGIVDLRNYPQIKKLSFNLRDFENFPLPQDGVAPPISLSHLRDITLKRDPSEQALNIQRFLNQTAITYGNLKSVTIEGFNGNTDQFHQILSKLSMANTITLEGVTEAPPASDTLPNLNHLDILQCRSSVEWVKTFGEQLRSLRWDLRYAPVRRAIMHKLTEESMRSIDFSKLKRMDPLCLPNVVVKGILQTAKDVNVICMTPGSSDQMEDIITHIIIKQEKLQFFWTHALHEHYDKMVESIEYGLFKTKQRKREKFIIGMVTNREINMDKFMMFIGRIVNAMILSNIEKYSIYADNRGDERITDQQVMENAVNEYIKSSPNVKLISLEKAGFEIGNVESLTGLLNLN